MCLQDPCENSTALDFSVKRQPVEIPSESTENICSGIVKVHALDQRPEANKLEDSPPSSALSTPTSPTHCLSDSSALKYKEQEYLSTSASESDYTSDDGDTTDVDTELDAENEVDVEKSHFLACVTLTVDTPDEATSENEATGEPGDNGDTNTLTN